jgi:3-oxoacyl-[acyl-carrier protein] reductase
MNDRQKTVLVTGGSGGIGRAICLAFSTAGWRVGVHYCSRQDEATQTVLLMGARNMAPNIYKADIRLADEVQAMVHAFIQDHDRLDTLICNAGISAGALVLRHRLDEWTRIIATNLTGTFHCLQAAGRSMADSGGGSIIIVGSYAGAQGSMGQAAYASAKAGLLGLMRTAAREWGAAQIRVNLVFPGWHLTPLAGNALPDDTHMIDHVLGHRATLEEVGRTICHLSELRDVSGQVWNLDSRPL